MLPQHQVRIPGIVSSAFPGRQLIYGDAGQGKGHILINLKEGDTWLEFGVLFKGETGMQWVREDCMDCDGLVCSCHAFQTAWHIMLL